MASKAAYNVGVVLVACALVLFALISAQVHDRVQVEQPSLSGVSSLRIKTGHFQMNTTHNTPMQPVMTGINVETPVYARVAFSSPAAPYPPCYPIGQALDDTCVVNDGTAVLDQYVPALAAGTFVDSCQVTAAFNVTADITPVFTVRTYTIALGGALTLANNSILRIEVTHRNAYDGSNAGMQLWAAGAYRIVGAPYFPVAQVGRSRTSTVAYRVVSQLGAAATVRNLTFALASSAASGDVWTVGVVAVAAPFSCATAAGVQLVNVSRLPQTFVQQTQFSCGPADVPTLCPECADAAATVAAAAPRPAPLCVAKLVNGSVGAGGVLLVDVIRADSSSQLSFIGFSSALGFGNAYIPPRDAATTFAVGSATLSAMLLFCNGSCAGKVMVWSTAEQLPLVAFVPDFPLQLRLPPRLLGYLPQNLTLPQQAVLDVVSPTSPTMQQSGACGIVVGNGGGVLVLTASIDVPVAQKLGSDGRQQVFFTQAPAIFTSPTTANLSLVVRIANTTAVTSRVFCPHCPQPLSTPQQRTVSSVLYVFIEVPFVQGMQVTFQTSASLTLSVASFSAFTAYVDVFNIK